MAVDDARMGNDEYRIAHNVRNRFGDLRPTRRPLKIASGLASDVPFQAIYAVGDFIIIVQRGVARFKHRLSDTWATLWDSSTNPT